MSNRPDLPTRPPIKARNKRHRFPVFSIGMNIVLMLGLLLLWQRTLTAEPPPTQIVAQVTASNPPAEPPPTPSPVPSPTPSPMPASVHFGGQNLFGFDEPIRIPVEYANLDLSQIQVDLLTTSGDPFPAEDIRPEWNESEISLPQGRLVGSFQLRISLSGEELGTFAFEVRPPKLSLEAMLDVQPRLDIVAHLEGLAKVHPDVADSLRGKYLLLPEYSTLSLQDEYRSRGWVLNVVDLAENEWETTDKGIHLTKDYDRTRDALPVEIVLTGVYDQNGNPYTYKDVLPLIAQQPLQNIEGNLFVYNVPADGFLVDKGNTKNVMLDPISKFKDVFGLNGAEITSGDKTYRFVMLIGTVKSLASNQIDSDSRWEKFPKYDSIQNKAVRTVSGGGYGNLKQSCQYKDFFVVDLMDADNAKIALFGFVEVQPAEEAGQ